MKTSSVCWLGHRSKRRMSGMDEVGHEKDEGTRWQRYAQRTCGAWLLNTPVEGRFRSAGWTTVVAGKCAGVSSTSWFDLSSSFFGGRRNSYFLFVRVDFSFCTLSFASRLPIHSGQRVFPAGCHFLRHRTTRSSSVVTGPIRCTEHP